MKKSKRKAKRKAQRAYEAAMSVPARRVPVGQDQSQDSAANTAQPQLLNWGRYLDSNHDFVVGCLDELVARICGRGIMVIPKPLRVDGSVDQELGVTLLDEWNAWTRRADVTGELSYNAVQRMICRAWLRDGEHFRQHVSGRNAGYPFEAGEVPYRLELLESEMCPIDYDAPDRGYKQGVQSDDWNRPLAYAIYKQQPNDFVIGSPTVTFDDLKVVDRSIMSHIKLVRRWPATRGVSLLHSVITRLYDIKDVEESERLKNRILASWTAAINRAPDMPGWENADESGQRYLAMAGGTVIDTLAPGETIAGVGPDYPNPIQDYIGDQVRRVASGLGARYSAISKHYDGNYAAQRQEMVESEAHYQIREDAFTDSVPRVDYERFVSIALAAGIISYRDTGRDGLRRLLNAEYRGPITPWIDPLKEVQADALAVEKGFVTLEQIQIKRGASPEIIGKPAPRPVQLSLIPPDDEDEEAAA